MVLVLAENLNCFLFALAAIGGNTELLLQLPKIAHAAFSRFADLSISNCVADADVHAFQYRIRSGIKYLTSNANDCQLYYV
jgi:hypothetical protein